MVDSVVARGEQDQDPAPAARRVCACEDTDPEEVRDRVMRHRAERRQRGLSNALDSRTKYVAIRYRVLYRDESEKVSERRLQAQHQVLNAMLNMKNDDRLHVPETGPYGFRDRQGSCNLVHLPIDHTQVTEASGIVEYIRVPAAQRFEGQDPLLDVLRYMASRGDLDTVVDGVMNFFVAPIGGGILGQADTTSNYCVVLNTAVGGPSALGELSSYRLGKTGVHEVLHCYGLEHIFNNGGCSGPQLIDDIPRQKTPNYDGRLSSDGVASHCNRHRDCEIYRNGDASFTVGGASQPYSCLPCDSKLEACDECDTAEREMHMNVMGYSPDTVLVMITKGQAEAVNDYLESSDNTSITLLDRPDGAVGETLDQLTVPNEVPEGTPMADGDGDGGGRIAWWWVLIIVVAALVVVLGLVALFRRGRNSG